MSDWKDLLPEAARDNPELDSVKADTLEDATAALAERVQGLRQSLGGAIRPPGEDADDEARAAFAKRLDSLGFAPKDEVPEDAAGYSADVDAAGIPPEILDNWVESRRQHYANAKLPKAAAAKLLARDTEVLRGAIAGYHKDVEMATKSVQEAYGDNAPQAIKNAERAAKHTGIDDLLNQPLMTMDGQVVSLGNRPEVIDMLSKIGANLGEDKSGKPQGADGAIDEDIGSVRDQRTMLLKEYSAMMRKNPGDPELAITRKKLHGLSKRIAAHETGDASLLTMTPEHIAKFTGRG